MSHEGSNLEIRAMTNDVQNRKRLSAQWNEEHVQSNDAVKLLGAWDCGLSRRLWFRVCVADCTTIFTSDIFEHYRFRVSCLQHFQKLSPRWMSQVSMILIHHLDLSLHGTLLSIMLLDSSRVSTSSRSILVVSRTPVGTEGVGHHWNARPHQPSPTYTDLLL